MALSKDRMCRGRGWAHAWELMLATSLGSRPARNAGPLAQLTCCPPRSHPGLPDEAFESLTQLEHLYVAHNKVSLYVALRGCILAGVAQDAGPGCGSWGGGGRKRAPGPDAVAVAAVRCTPVPATLPACRRSGCQ